MGIVSLKLALSKAEEFNLDLVEVAPQAKPSVCRIMDFSKYKYEQEKREREAKKHRRGGHIKEVRFRPSIDEHDYQVKISRIKGFLEKGDKVRVRLIYRGREVAHQETGKALMERIVKDIASLGKIERNPVLLGKVLVMVLGPTGK